jgi:RNA polymerase sigma-70 factor (ECF subfamily)
MSAYIRSDPEQLIDEARSVQQPGELLDLYRNYLRVLAQLGLSRRLNGRVDASDVVQQTLLQAHRTFRHFRGNTEQELLGWLRQILAHVLANVVRHHLGTHRCHVTLECEMDAQLDRSSQGLERWLADPRASSPSHRAARRERAVILTEALQRLPDDYREVLLLRHVEELTFPQIAERMDRSLDSVKNLWARALGRIRTLTRTDA